MAITPQGKHISSLYKWGIFLGVAVVVIASIGYYTRTKPLPVNLWTVEPGTVEATVSNNRAGTVKACRRAKMSPPAGGQISKLTVKKGERVVAGQVLLELWHKDLYAQKELAQEQFKTSSSRVKEVCAMSEAAQRDAERAVQLKEQGFISSQLLDRSQTDAKARQASCEAAKGEVEQSSARIEVARAGLERMTLRAPFSGIVADISGELGEYATPSPPGIPTLPAIDLIDDSCLYVSAPIDEVDASVVKVGQLNRITLDAIKGKQFPGKVTRIAPYVIELEKQARTVEVEVVFTELPNGQGRKEVSIVQTDSARPLPNPPPKGEGTNASLREFQINEENLLVGYSADIEIVHTVKQKVLRIPTQHLMEGKRVLLYKTDGGADGKPEGKLEERVVATGLANWQYTEIVSGLKQGDQIVASLDRTGVKAGVKVKPEANLPEANPTEAKSKDGAAVKPDAAKPAP